MVLRITAGIQHREHKEIPTAEMLRKSTERPLAPITTVQQFL
jgi:hypothetical protein